MEVITREIERGLNAGLYYLALICALSLPDICAALESPDGETTGQRYKEWYTAWLAPQYPELTAKDVYSLRCGVLHQGRIGTPKCQYERILFSLPNAHHNTAHRNMMSKRETLPNGNAVDHVVLNLDLKTFCQDMITAVSRWYAAKQTDPNVQNNLPRLVQYYERGLAPFIVGLPLIS